MAVVLSVGSSPLLHRHRQPHSRKTCFHKRGNSNVNMTGGTLLLFSKGTLLGVKSAVNFFNPSSFRVRSFQKDDTEYSDSASYIDNSERQDKMADVGSQEIITTGTRSSLLAQLAILLGIAATVTVLSICLKQPNQGSSSGIQILAGGASTSALPGVGFSFNAFGYKIILPEYTPGWVYFWLLMAAGCGLFISEEALNIWVGISIARMLSLDGTRQSLVESFSRNAPHILSTVLWVYWGVCISDMIPFYLGRLFKKSGASDDVYSKLGINKDKALELNGIVQRYGNLIGFVERFSLGVRNPTAFFAGALGISPEYFFAGVCCGGLITLPVQVKPILIHMACFLHSNIIPTCIFI
ncbi:SNARE associated Golgi protein [Artemisia annua]|uniref:SNARE associated Golgi protein n=1 Tax=Artemisia annua TaxID=35608 RepID=A0A2U1NWB9_ARTAN|nr:SNARE associated Golgi protein [Artemisia annua]